MTKTTMITVYNNTTAMTKTTMTTITLIAMIMTTIAGIRTIAII